MSVISLKSISGITSITTPAGVDNQFTLHNNNTTEAVKLDTAGNLHFHNHLNITGVSTASNFKTGTSNLHNTGLNVQDLDVDGHTNLDNVSVAGVSTHSDHVQIIDGKRLKVGSATNGDLILLHDGTDSIIDNSTGNLFFRSATHKLQALNGNDMIIGNTGGAVELYHNNNRKFFTTSFGTQISCDPDGDGLKLEGTTNRIDIVANTNRSGAQNTILELDAHWNNTSVAFMAFATGDDTTNKDDGRIRFFTKPSGGTIAERLRITSNGNVGIGIVDPDQQLEVSGIVKVGSYFQGGASGTATNNWHFGAEGNGEFRFYTGNYGAGNLKQTINNNGDVLPGVHNTSDLGSSSKRWRNVYTTDLQLSNEGKSNDVDGTWGNYTIQEGESELFLINNRNGKKYVFLLKEVS